MNDLHFDQVGFPAAPTQVVETPWRSDLAESHPSFRKVELFPARYDDRQLYVRALERRVPR